MLRHVVVWLVVFGMMLFPSLFIAGQDSSAWQALLSDYPAMVEDRSVPAEERRILQALSLESAEAYLAGKDPATIVLPGGETLEDFINRMREERAAGLVFQPTEPCRVLDTRTIEPLRDENVNVELQGTNLAEPCGLPGFVGDELKTHRARSVMLRVSLQDVQGDGDMVIWPANDHPEPLVGLVRLSESNEQNVVASLCDEISSEPCADGDVTVRVRGGSAHVVLDVVGYFEPARQLWGESVEPDEQFTDKSTVTPWQSDNVTDIYYTGGYVGIGTDSPQRSFHLLGDFQVSATEDDVSIFDTDRFAHTGYAGGAAHDASILRLHSAYETNGIKDRRPILLASPEVSGRESTYIYAFGSKNLRLGTANDNHRRSEIELYNDNTTTGKILFRTGGWKDSSNTPGVGTGVRMIIEGNGDVGIGAGLPEARLDLRSGGDDLQLRLSDSLTSGENTSMGYSSDKNFFAIRQRAGSEENAFLINYAAGWTDPVFQFDTNTNPSAVVITENGRLGIGTTTPSKALHVAGAGRFGDSIILADNTELRGEGARSTTADGGIFFNSASAGSGTINDNSGYGGYMLYNVYWDGTTWRQPRGTYHSQVFTINRHHDTSWFRSGPKNVDHGEIDLELTMTIRQANGYVGIGTESPVERLDVAGNLQLSGVAPGVARKIASDGDLDIESEGDICIGNCD